MSAGGGGALGVELRERGEGAWSIDRGGAAAHQDRDADRFGDLFE